MKQDESIELFPKKLKRAETLTQPAEIFILDCKSCLRVL